MVYLIALQLAELHNEILPKKENNVHLSSNAAMWSTCPLTPRASLQSQVSVAGLEC